RLLGGKRMHGAAQKSGLARPRIARHDEKSLAAGNRKQQCGERLTMLFRQEQKARIGSHRKWIPLQAEEGVIHPRTAPRQNTDRPRRLPTTIPGKVTPPPAT